MLLLDTHAWIWAVEGNERRIGRRARRRLASAVSQDGVFVSPVSVFEVAALHASGRLRLARSPDVWIREALQGAGIRVADLLPQMAIDAGAIMRSALSDPLDRLIVATARHLDAVLLTSDTQILAYAAKSGSVEVSDASA